MNNENKNFQQLDDEALEEVAGGFHVRGMDAAGAAGCGKMVGGNAIYGLKAGLKPFSATGKNSSVSKRVSGKVDSIGQNC